MNGTLGTVVDIVWNVGSQDPRKGLPKAVLVKYDGYDGKTYTWDGIPAGVSLGVVPIVPREVQFDRENVSCSRTQFPVALAYAITVHKSQGMTLSQAVIDIADPMLRRDATYVAVSRVKSLAGLMIECDFDYNTVAPQPKLSDTILHRERDHAEKEASNVTIAAICASWPISTIVVERVAQDDCSQDSHVAPLGTSGSVQLF